MGRFFGVVRDDAAALTYLGNFLQSVAMLVNWYSIRHTDNLFEPLQRQWSDVEVR